VPGHDLPDKALARGGVRLVFSDYQLFGKFNAGSAVMSNRFIAENPNTVRKYVEGVGEAIEWARSRPREEVIARMESIIGKRGRNEDTAAIKFWTSTTWPPLAAPCWTKTSRSDRLARARRADRGGPGQTAGHLHQSIPAAARRLDARAFVTMQVER